MKSINPIITTIAVLLASLSLSLGGGKGWISDLNEGLEKAKKEGKPVLAEFTGSDWCPPCMMMQKKVFSKDEFVKKASEDYILVVVDSPNADPKLAEKNEKYFEKYKVQGVPTVVLLKSDGKEYDRFSASAHPSVDAFLKRIKK